MPNSNVRLFIRREDLLHPHVSGNKFRKLKYNIAQAKLAACPILTFGGAFSNHIAATAAAGKEAKIETIGVIRGEELAKKSLNPTLAFAKSCGMELLFINRELYREKDSVSFHSLLRQRFGDFYLLPEGGTNEAAVRGCEEILTPADFAFDYICCAAGTGGTVSGLSRSIGEQQQILAFAAVRDISIGETIKRYSQKSNWSLQHQWDFGGYGKITGELIDFINEFKASTGIPLDPIYTGKMMFGVMRMIDQGYFESGSLILAIHTGGLQGIEGMNKRLLNAKLPLIE